MFLFNDGFEEKVIAALEEYFDKELPEGFSIDTTYLADGIFDDNRLFSVITSVQKNCGCGDMADFAVNIFPDGNSLIYCMDDDVFYHTDVENIENALKQAVLLWENNEPHFEDMKTIKDTFA